MLQDSTNNTVNFLQTLIWSVSNFMNKGTSQKFILKRFVEAMTVQMISSKYEAVFGGASLWWERSLSMVGKGASLWWERIFSMVAKGA